FQGDRQSPKTRNGSHSRAEPEVRIHSPPAGRRYGAGGEDGNFVAYINRWSAAMPQPNDLSRSLVALDQDSTIIAVVELSQSSWLVGGILPGIERQPRKKWSRALSGCLPSCIAGATSQSGLAARSRGLRLPSKPAVTASGWRRVGSRRT